MDEEIILTEVMTEEEHFGKRMGEEFREEENWGSMVSCQR